MGNFSGGFYGGVLVVLCLGVLFFIALSTIKMLFLCPEGKGVT